MALAPKEILPGRKVKCSDCGRLLSINDRGTTWERCHVCGAIICINDMYYNRVQMKGRYSYYYDAIRVCKKHHNMASWHQDLSY